MRMGPGSPPIPIRNTPGIGTLIFSQFSERSMIIELEEVREGMRAIIRGDAEKEFSKVEAEIRPVSPLSSGPRSKAETRREVLTKV